MEPLLRPNPVPTMPFVSSFTGSAPHTVDAVEMGNLDGNTLAECLSRFLQSQVRMAETQEHMLQCRTPAAFGPLRMLRQVCRRWRWACSDGDPLDLWSTVFGELYGLTELPRLWWGEGMLAFSEGERAVLNGTTVTVESMTEDGYTVCDASPVASSGWASLSSVPRDALAPEAPFLKLCLILARHPSTPMFDDCEEEILDGEPMKGMLYNQKVLPQDIHYNCWWYAEMVTEFEENFARLRATTSVALAHALALTDSAESSVNVSMCLSQLRFTANELVDFARLKNKWDAKRNAEAASKRAMTEDAERTAVKRANIQQKIAAARDRLRSWMNSGPHSEPGGHPCEVCTELGGIQLELDAWSRGEREGILPVDDYFTFCEGVCRMLNAATRDLKQALSLRGLTGEKWPPHGYRGCITKEELVKILCNVDQRLPYAYT